MARRHFSSEQIEARKREAARLWFDGFTMAEIGRRLDVSRERIRQHLVELGVLVQVRTATGHEWRTFRLHQLNHRTYP